jgi:hypothetical protein
MASKFFRNGVKRINKTSMLLHQKRLIEKHFSFLSCKMENNVLSCEGIIKSLDYKYDYRILVKCVYGLEPYVKIVEPNEIIPSSYIHMYDDFSLCLSYPKDMKWHCRTPIYSYTIPWIVEWCHYYELYLINGGVWEGPESPIHMQQNEKNIFEDID